MKDTLRLIVTEECNRNCEGCCNKQYDLPSLPVATDFTGYKQIILTGGEPLLDPGKLMKTISHMRKENPDAEIILYTAYLNDPYIVALLMPFVDGMTVTLHEPEDVEQFQRLHSLVHTHSMGSWLSLRLNVFQGIPLDSDWYDSWTIKSDIIWIEDCPLPEGEELMRYERSY